MSEIVQDKLVEITALFMGLGKSMGELLQALVEEKREEEPVKAPVEGKKEEEPVEAPVEGKKEEEPEKKYTLEDVRKALAAKSSGGFTEQVRELLQKHGGSKLSAIAETEYAAIMEEVQQIGSAQ